MPPTVYVSFLARSAASSNSRRAHDDNLRGSVTAMSLDRSNAVSRIINTEPFRSSGSFGGLPIFVFLFFFAIEKLYSQKSRNATVDRRLSAYTITNVVEDSHRQQKSPLSPWQATTGQRNPAFARPRLSNVILATAPALGKSLAWLMSCLSSVVIRSYGTRSKEIRSARLVASWERISRAFSANSSGRVSTAETCSTLT